MKISWTGVAVLAIAVAGSIAAAALGSHDLSIALGGLAVGLSTKLGAVGSRPSGGGAMPPFLIVLLAWSLSSTATGCKPEVVEAEPAEVEQTEGSE